MAIRQKMVFLYLKNKIMKKSSLVIIIYILGIIFGAVFLDIWNAETNPKKALLGISWTALFAIGLYYSEKNK